jgi:general secretion pathway protein G
MEGQPSRRFDLGDNPHHMIEIACLLVLIVVVVYYIVMPRSVSGDNLQRQIRAVKTQINIFESALDMFEVDTGRYPSTSEGLEPLIEKPKDVSEEHWHGPYLVEGIPFDPWKNEYQYQYQTNNKQKYTIISAGPDGKFGTDDDITNFDDTQ